MLFKTIRSRAIALALIPLLFLISLIVIAIVQRSQAAGLAALVRASDVRLARAHDLNVTVAAMNRALRDYLSGNNATELAAYHTYAARVRRDARALEAITANDAEQAVRAKRLTGVADQAVLILDRYVALYSAGRKAQAQALLQTPRARALGDQWSQASLGFAQTEERATFARWGQLRAETTWLDTLRLVAVVVGFLLTLLALWLFGLGIARRLEVLKSEALLPGEQTTHGGDEITQLAKAYRRMAKRLIKREQQLLKYRLLADHTQDIILFVNRRERRILDANDAALKAYGYTREELLALDAFDLRAPSTVQSVNRDLQGVEDHGVTFQTIHRRKDGTEFPVELTAESVEMGGERVIVEILRDISERRKTEERMQEAYSHALEASTLKSQFVATMSHEIRTPMNAVIGMTELLLDSGLNEEQLYAATVIRDSGQLLLNLINDILDFSRIEAKRVDMELAQFSPIQIVESTATLLSRQAAEKNIALLTFIDPAIPKIIVGDPGRLRQILVNLVGNALKFTERGSVIASVDLLSKGDEIVRLGFAVEDTGIGIPEKTIQHLFEPFRQADGSTTRKYGGSGLGLSISRGLVELMGGSFNVTSTVGKGSRFAFELEFRYIESVEEPPLFQNERVLIVDDDGITRDVFARYLRSWNIRCDSVSGGVEAMAIMHHAASNRDPFTIALLDLNMPGMDGFELGKLILADPALQNTRLIMVTAYDRIGQGRQAINAGFSAYLSKPLRQSELYDSIVEGRSNMHEMSAKANGTNGPTKAGRVLVAEDNSTNRQLALLQLQKLGVAAEAVADGKEAIEAASDGRFTTILMDCQMPNMDGFEATRLIRKAEARTGGHIRIIAMTANALAEDRVACIAAGMDDYLAKPISLEGLRRVLLGNAQTNGHGAGSSTILNVERLEDLFGNDRERTLGFLDEALPKLQVVADRLRNAVTNDERRAAAHELKGAAANLGAEELAKAASTGQPEEVDAALRRLVEASIELSQNRA